MEQSRTEKARARSVNFCSHLYRDDKVIKMGNIFQRGYINLEERSIEDRIFKKCLHLKGGKAKRSSEGEVTV